MTVPRTYRVPCLSPRGFHRLHVTEWGDPANPAVLICVHGLTRNGRDFDPLAQALAGRYRVLCPDVAGRGESDRIAPALYGYPQYCADLAAVIAASGAAAVDWVGTSMGGLIGMMLAAQPGTPIRRLVVNDVGPFIPKAAIAAIGAYVGDASVFDTVADAAAYVARVNAGFGPLSPADWHVLAQSSVRSGADGKFVWKRDPAIAAAFTAQPPADVTLWPVWDAIRAPTLVLRGADSGLLLAETAAEMTRRGPRARLETIPLCGHAPALRDSAQIGLVHDFVTAAV